MIVGRCILSAECSHHIKTHPRTTPVNNPTHIYLYTPDMTDATSSPKSPDHQSPVIVTRTPVRVLYVRAIYDKQHACVNTTCELCQRVLNIHCSTCDAQTHASHAACSIVIGTCNHGYHKHCLDTWLNTNPACPIDMQQWTLKKYHQ